MGRGEEYPKRLINLGVNEFNSFVKISASPTSSLSTAKLSWKYFENILLVSKGYKI